MEEVVGFNWLKLPEDMKMEILKRVPENALSRFKCVSKSWYHSISTILAPLSGFIYTGRHHIRQKEFIDYIPCNGAKTESKGRNFMTSLLSMLPFEPTDDDLQDCCNGLLLFLTKHVILLEFFVCNSFTKQCIPIPVYPAHNSYSTSNFLAFDPRVSHNYRIMHITWLSEDQRTVDVFSSETGKWVTHFISVIPDIDRFLRRPVYLNGIVYLLTIDSCLWCFDQNLNVQHFELPWKKHTNHYGCIGASNGSMFYSNNDYVSIKVWLLEDSTNGGGGVNCLWTLKYNIELCDLFNSPHGSILKEHHHDASFNAYAFHPFSDVIFIGVPQMIFCYHLHSKSLKVLFTATECTTITWGQVLTYCYRPCSIVLKNFRTGHQGNLVSNQSQ